MLCTYMQSLQSEFLAPIQVLIAIKLSISVPDHLGKLVELHPDGLLNEIPSIWWKIGLETFLPVSLQIPSDILISPPRMIGNYMHECLECTLPVVRSQLWRGKYRNLAIFLSSENVLVESWLSRINHRISAN